MNLIFFWVKIAVKRITALFNSSPVLIIWTMIIIGSFFYAIVNKHIEIALDMRTLFVVIPFLVLSSLLNSFKNYNLMPMLIVYSKSKLTNKNICSKFFIKQTLKNNILLLVFAVIAYNYIADKKYYAVIIGTTIFSIILSFILMYVKNIYLNRRTAKTITKKSKINPIIKSALYDYLAPNFLPMAIICIAFFLLIIVEFTKDINSLYELKNQPVFFILMTIVFSIGFMGIVESIPNINWKFQAIISPNDFKYHIKRTSFFLCGIFGWLLALFIIIGGIINPSLLLKYLYCIFVLFFVTLHISFTMSSMIMKAITLLIITVLTIWISTLSVGFLAVLIIPILVTLFKAKNEYMEWSLL